MAHNWSYEMLEATRQTLRTGADCFIVLGGYFESFFTILLRQVSFALWEKLDTLWFWVLLCKLTEGISTTEAVTKSKVVGIKIPRKPLKIIHPIDEESWKRSFSPYSWSTSAETSLKYGNVITGRVVSYQRSPVKDLRYAIPRIWIWSGSDLRS